MRYPQGCDNGCPKGGSQHPVFAPPSWIEESARESWGGGGTRRYPGLTLMYRRSRGGGCAGDEEDDNDRYKVNGDKVKGDVLQWREATRNGAAITLSGYNCKVGRGAMSRWWAGWVAERC